MQKEKYKMKSWIKTILLLSITGSSFSCQNNEKFDSSKWKQGGGENLLTEMRLNMGDDIISSGILEGKNEIEISKLLGSPEPVHSETVENTKFYPVMEKYEWNIDPEELIYLEVKFDQTGRAKTVKVYKTR